jgi:hypothetical protein
MRNGQEKAEAALQVEKRKRDRLQVDVRVTIELAGKLDERKLDKFTERLRDLLRPDRENGGNGS